MNIITTMCKISVLTILSVMIELSAAELVEVVVQFSHKYTSLKCPKKYSKRCMNIQNHELLLTPVRFSNFPTKRLQYDNISTYRWSGSLQFNVSLETHLHINPGGNR
jgi:hypothetical protein